MFHQPPCPSAMSSDYSAGVNLAAHPDPGWSVICTSVIVFVDYGQQLPQRQRSVPLAPTRLITLAA